MTLRTHALAVLGAVVLLGACGHAAASSSTSAPAPDPVTTAPPFTEPPPDAYTVKLWGQMTPDARVVWCGAVSAWADTDRSEPFNPPMDSRTLTEQCMAAGLWKP